MNIFVPTSIKELQTFLFTKPKFCILGAGFSHGGHTLLENGFQINMKHINNISYNPNNQIVTIGAGCCWYDVINHLLKYNRTIAVMQSYHNFSIGGSISVNCHGRAVKYGSIANTIVEMTVMLSNGSIIICDRNNNYDLFSGVIGGYGMLGIIIEAKLITTSNDKIKCIVIENNDIYNFDDDVILYNAMIYPSRERFRYGNTYKIYNYVWIPTDDEITNNNLINSNNRTNYKYLIGQQLLRISDVAKVIRSRINDSVVNVHYKSFEIGYDANELEPLSRHPNTTVLQEYFIPVGAIKIFLREMLDIINEINIINISIRYVKKTTDSVLNHSPVDSYSVVLYFATVNNEFFLRKHTKWTNKMLDITMRLGGKFYLPYLRTYSKETIMEMYKNELNRMMELKLKYDPDKLIINEWVKYMEL